MHTRYVSRRLRTQFATLKIVGVFLTEQDVAEVRQRQPPLMADELGSSLQQALAHVISLISVRQADTPDIAAA